MEDYSGIVDDWQNDDSNTKFKMGEEVIYKDKKYTIKGINVVDINEVEYALIGYPYLVWENELHKGV
jgi:hypothetical protein